MTKPRRATTSTAREIPSAYSDTAHHVTTPTTTPTHSAPHTFDPHTTTKHYANATREQHVSLPEGAHSPEGCLDGHGVACCEDRAIGSATEHNYDFDIDTGDMKHNQMKDEYRPHTHAKQRHLLRHPKTTTHPPTTTP